MGSCQPFRNRSCQIKYVTSRQLGISSHQTLGKFICKQQALASQQLRMRSSQQLGKYSCRQLQAETEQLKENSYQVQQLRVGSCQQLLKVLQLLAALHVGDCCIPSRQQTELRQGGPNSSLPVVLWHGINDNAQSMEEVEKLIRTEDPDIYIRNIMIGESLFSDKVNSYLFSTNRQVQYVCDLIKADRELSQGFNALGWSQGGLLMRGVLQRCEGIKIKNLVTIGAPHQGIFGIPKCINATDLLCNLLSSLATDAYSPAVQSLVTPAQYWHDPRQHDLYVKASQFLADINCERDQATSCKSYRARLVGLEQLVLVMWSNDSTIIPAQSAHFAFYTPHMKILPLRESSLYLSDRLGLRELDDRGGLQLLQMTGDHNHLEPKWLSESVIKRFLVTA